MMIGRKKMIITWVFNTQLLCINWRLWLSLFTFESLSLSLFQVLRNDIEVLAEEAEKEIRTQWNITNRSHFSSVSQPPTIKFKSSFAKRSLISPSINCIVKLHFQRPEGANFRDGRDAEEVGKAVAASGQGQMSPAGDFWQCWLLSIGNDQKDYDQEILETDCLVDQLDRARSSKQAQISHHHNHHRFILDHCT